jgi:hypothetical protein
MKFLNIVFFSLFTLYFTGCVRLKTTGLSATEVRQHKNVMVANADIQCRDLKIKKGTVLAVYSIGGQSYQGFNIFSKEIFPEDTLFLPLDEKYITLGFVVSSNGEFFFEDGKMITPAVLAVKWNVLQLIDCHSDVKVPFRLKNIENRNEYEDEDMFD